MKDGINKPAAMGDIFRHLWLVKSVSSAVGVDIGEALAKGKLDAAEYSHMVTSCRGAGCSNSCALWLAQQKGQSSAPPEFCTHHQRLKQLMP